MKTSELTGAALDWAVAKCEGLLHDDGTVSDYWQPSELWEQAGPIIEREGLVVDIRKEHGWVAAREFWYLQDAADHDLCSTGPTYLIAAMRCYVASKLGDDVDLPEGLT